MNQDIEKIALLIEDEDLDEAEELAQGVADEIYDISQSRELPLYPEVSGRAIYVKSPEDWTVALLNIGLWEISGKPEQYEPRIKVEYGSRHYDPVQYDMHDPEVFNKIYELCKEQYAKMKKRSIGRLRLPRG